MENAFRPISRNTAVDAVERRLRGEILRGGLAPGTKLPPERELALRLGVNRLTLRAALARLSAAGLVASQQGGANRVQDYRLRAGLDRLPELADAFAEEPATVARLIADLLALRRAIATEAAVEAARRITPADSVRLRDLAAAQQARAGDPEAFLHGDLELTREIVRVSGNVAFQLAFNTVAQFATQRPDLLTLMIESPAAHCLAYEALIALLETRDGPLIRETLRGALEALDAGFMSRVHAYLQLPFNAGEPHA